MSEAKTPPKLPIVPTYRELLAQNTALCSRITELTQCDPSWYDMSVADAFRLWKADREELEKLRAEKEITDAELLVKCKDCNRHDIFDELVELRAEVERLKGELAENDQLDEIGASNLKGIEEYLNDQRELQAENERLKGEVVKLERRVQRWKGQTSKYQEAEQWQKGLKEKAESALTRCRNEADGPVITDSCGCVGCDLDRPVDSEGYHGKGENRYPCRCRNEALEEAFTAGAIFGWDACENNWQEDGYESKKAEALRALKTSPGADKGLRDGEPCRHPGCASHISHPCEGCGRIGARNALKTSPPTGEDAK